MGLPEPSKKAMRTFSRDKKWTMIVQSGAANTSANTSNTPESVISKLKADFSVKNTESLRIALASSNMSWLKKFVKHKGLILFFNNFSNVLQKPTYVLVLVLVAVVVTAATDARITTRGPQTHSHCIAVRPQQVA